MLRSHAICRELLEVTNGMKKLSDELQIRTQSPVQEKEKQNDKSNYNQVFQTASSAIGSSSSLLLSRIADFYNAGLCSCGII
jgi:hypothetical protein